MFPLWSENLSFQLEWLDGSHRIGGKPGMIQDFSFRQTRRRLLRFFFHQMLGVRSVRRNHFVRQPVRNIVLVRIFHRVRCPCLRFRCEVRRVAEQLRQRKQRFDDDVVSAFLLNLLLSLFNLTPVASGSPPPFALRHRGQFSDRQPRHQQYLAWRERPSKGHL